ncbi:hypothetical protein [Methylobacterium organophilum]|uniref:Uncharacterized protein n=2 Tax=Methylobacterium organophilum TaxID=410 RepID=A0ABQ4T3U3_METOR|nr:hypothetical protein [Methylobacterium organophilum]GJE25262.1 hypothetical protein LKMONMHP_0096 [Methylobacterium organophilum]
MNRESFAELFPASPVIERSSFPLGGRETRMAAQEPVMAVFDAKDPTLNSDDAALLAHVLHPTPATRAHAKLRGRRLLKRANPFAVQPEDPTPAVDGALSPAAR